jgi:hypothetical protein
VAAGHFGTPQKQEWVGEFSLMRNINKRFWITTTVELFHDTKKGSISP